MKLVPIGVGQAGGKIVDQLTSHDAGADLDVIVDGLAVNSARPDLVALRHLPQERRVLIGQAENNGHGVGADNSRGARVLNDDIEDILYRLEEIKLDEADAFLIAAGLGGGMGSGGAPVLAKYLTERYDKPVYAVGMLPASSEGHLTAINAMSSLKTLVHYTENIILFDNEEWMVDDETLGASYQSMNDQLVIQLATLFGATEPMTSSEVGEKVVDAADLRETLASGDLSVIGYSDTELEHEEQGFLRGLLGSGPDLKLDTIEDDVRTVIQEATLGRLTAPAPLIDVDAVLAIAAGPPEALTHGGLDAATEWLDAETNRAEIRSGDYPITDDGSEAYAAGIVVLSGLPVVNRLVELYDRVVGLDQIPGLEGNEVEATEVMESFFTDDIGPGPLFTDYHYDLDELAVAQRYSDIGDIPSPENEEAGFEWRDIDEDLEPADASVTTADPTTGDAGGSTDAKPWEDSDADTDDGWSDTGDTEATGNDEADTDDEADEADEETDDGWSDTGDTEATGNDEADTDDEETDDESDDDEDMYDIGSVEVDPKKSDDE